MVRAPFYDNGVKKGAWSKEEDERLKAFIQKHGHSNWRQLPKIAGLARCGKSCRLRWLNYLRPDLKHGNYTLEEEEIIIKLHQKFGNRWSLIAEKLPGRTDSEVKNYWHSYLKKCPKSNHEFTTSELKSMPSPDDNIVEENTTNQLVAPESSTSSTVRDEFPYILESSMLMSTETSSDGDNYCSPTSNFEESTTSCPKTKEDNFEESTISCPGTNEDIFAPWVTIFEELGSDFWTEPFVTEDIYTAGEMCSSKEMVFLTPNFYDETNLF